MEIKKLNSLRGLAALIVLLTHFSDVTGWLDVRLGGPAGQYGVMLFFLLSGFLMGYLYLTKPFSADAVRGYILARAGRVLPLYLLVVLASFATATYGSGGLFDINGSSRLIAHLLLLDGEDVLWTIAPEIHFYLLFIPLWMIGSRWPGYVYVITVAVLISLFLCNFPRPHGEFMGLPYDIHLFRSLPYFMVGVALGACYPLLTIPSYLRKNAFLLTLLLIPLLYPEFSPVTSYAKRRMWLSYEVLVVMATVFFAVVFLVPDDNKLLNNRVGDFIGKISYSLYLLHMPVIVYLQTFDLPDEVTLVLFLVSSISLAWLFYIAFERPLARRIRRSSSIRRE